MRQINKFYAAAVLLMASASVSSAAEFGYCTDVVSRDNIFRVGTSEKQGVAIRLSKGKLAMLKGCTISGISTAFGSSRTIDGNVNLFITTDLNAEPLVSQTSKITGAVKWIDFDLDDNYTITGDEDCLYIGYTAEINAKSTMLMADGVDVVPGCSFVYGDGVWTDAGTIGCGNVSLKVNIPDAPPITDMAVKSVGLGSFFKSGASYALSGQAFNFGNEAVHSFDLVVSIDDKPVSTAQYRDLDISQGQIIDFDFSPFVSDTEGYQDFMVEVCNVNGSGDSDESDNRYTAELFFYPQEMERSILLEGFTGQYCSNCPTGHATIDSFLEDIDSSVVEVMHHSGYSPDFMTMDADLDYTYFYGSPSTYAPAVMLNRTTVPTLGSCPVLNVTAKNLETAYAQVSAQEPYVSLSVESTYNHATHEVTVKFRSYTHNDLPSDRSVLNVMLTQDNIVAYQTPYGANYTHNAVFRGVLTGNSWGILLPENAAKAGGTAEWTTTFELPEGIFSDYYNWEELSDNERIAYTIAVNPDNMNIVAYVAAYSDSQLSGHTVYNAVMTRLGESYVQGGMASNPIIIPDDSDKLDIRVVNRHIVVNGEYDLLQVYSIDGIDVSAKSELTPGLYIVRALSAGKETVVKALVK